MQRTTATNEGKAKVREAIMAIVTKAKELVLPTKGAGDFAALMLAAGALINGDEGQITSADVLAVLADVTAAR